MSRGPRYIPPGWSVEVSTSTVCGFYTLPVTPQFRRIFIGILGRAQEKHPVKIHAVVATSTHYHMILTPEDAEQLAKFMGFVNSNLAREAGRLIGWRGSFWRERYHLIPVSPESEALVGRLRYVLSNTIKEFLVATVREWEGVHCGEALMDGKPMQGVWYARSIEYEAKRQAQRRATRRGTAIEDVDRGAFMQHYDVQLAPLPCWQDLPLATRRKLVAEMIVEIEAEAAARRTEFGIEPLGMDTIRQQDPLTRSVNSKRSPRPLCHAASKTMRERMRLAYSAFVEMFQEASLNVKRGRVTEAIFPKHSFPPSLPFVRIGDAIDPLADAGGAVRWATWSPTAS